MIRHQRTRKKQQQKSLFERLIYAFIGFVSVGLMSLLTIVPLLAWLLRVFRGRNFASAWLLVFIGLPAGLGLLASIWGFCSTDKMVDQLSYWWQRVMDHYSR